MANDRTININIKYNIDTGDVNKAKAASQQAQQATDNLRNAAQKAGTDSSAAYKRVGTSIFELQRQVDVLKYKITNSSNPKEVKQLSDQYKDVKLKLDLATQSALGFSKASKAVSQSIKDVSESSKQAGTNFTNLFTVVKLFAAFQVAKQIVSTALELTKLAGNVEGVSRAFERLTPNSVKTLNDLRAATHNTVTDFELMQRTLQATNLGVDLEKLPVLFEFAAARAQQTGESVDYLVDSIVRGIGRKSILVLDNLGLSATRLKEQFHGASLASQSVANVTRGVAEIAKVELEKMGGYAETGATKVDKLATSWENLRIAFSQQIQGSVLIDFFTKVNQDARKLVMGQEAYVLELAKTKASIEANKIVESDAYILAKNNSEERIKILSLEVVKLVESMNARKAEIRVQEGALAAQNQGYLGAGEREKIAADIKQRKDFNLATKETIDILRKYILQLREPEKPAGPQDTLGLLEEKLKEIKEQIVDTEGISTIAGKNEATRLQKEANLLQDRIEKIKYQINLEQNLRDLRAKAKNDDQVTNINTDKSTKVKNPVFGDTDKILKDFEILINEITPKIPPVKLKVTPYIPESDLEKLGDAFLKNKNDIIEQGDQMLKDQINSVLQNQVTAYDIEIAQTKRKYDTQIMLAGDNEKAKDRLRVEEDKKIQRLEQQRNERQKKNALSSILINTALGIVKAFATSATIYDGIVEAALVASEGAGQYAIAARQPTGFAKGVIDLKGPGTGTSDSIHARLSKGESVMTSAETKRSVGILRAIRNNKIDDRILHSIDFAGGRQEFNDSRMVQELQRLNQKKGPDIVQQGRTIYEVHQVRSNFKRFIRSKSM